MYEDLPPLEQQAFIKITELIGELSWGRELKPPIIFEFQDVLGGELKQYAAKPESMEPIFDAIYQKLRLAPDYNPFVQMRQEIAFLKSEVKVLREENHILRDRLTRYDMAKHLLKDSGGE